MKEHVQSGRATNPKLDDFCLNESETLVYALCLCTVVLLPLSVRLPANTFALATATEMIDFNMSDTSAKQDEINTQCHGVHRGQGGGVMLPLSDLLGQRDKGRG